MNENKFDPNFLTTLGIISSEDKILICRIIVDMLPEDKNFYHFDGDSDNDHLGRKMAYAIGINAFRDLDIEESLIHTLGFLFVEFTDYEKARTCFLEQCKKQPEEYTVYDNIAWCDMKLGRYHEGLDYSKKALQLNPKVPNLYDTHAAILFGLGQLDQAIAIADKGIKKVDPNLPELNYQMAFLLEQRGDFQDAETFWQKYLTIVDNNYAYKNAILRVLDKLVSLGKEVQLPDFLPINKQKILARFRKAHQGCQPILKKIESKNKDVEQINSMVGLFVEAICESYKELIDGLVPISLGIDKFILSQYFNLYAKSRLLQGNSNDTEDWLRKSLSLSPGNPEAKKMLFEYLNIKIS